MAQKEKLNKKRLFIHSATSLVDQAMLSLLNLAVGLTLIRLTSKEDYGIYSQLFVLGLFAFVITDSLISNPLTTIAPRKSVQACQQLFADLYKLQLRLNTLLAVFFSIGSGVAMYLYHKETSALLLGCAFGIYVFLNAQREYQRSIHFVQGRSKQVLLIDGAYVTAVTASFAVLVLLDWLSVTTVFLALGCANLACMLITNRSVHLATSTSDTLKATRAEIWQRGKWSLPGALIGWFGNYSYLFLTALFLGITASADLNATRLLLMPISLGVVAWSRVARPVASQLFAEKKWRQLRRLSWFSILCIEAVVICYITLLWVSLPLLETYVLGPQYQNTVPLVMAWGAFFAISSLRIIGTSLLSSNDQYQHLLITTITCLIVMLVSSVILIPMYGTWGAIISLIIVEIIDLILIWGIFLPMAKRQRS